jgi:hypothetical protein
MVGLGIAAIASFAFAPVSVAAPPQDPTLEQFASPTINEVATRGPSGPLDQFVEIANPSRTQAIDISNWQVRMYSSANMLLQVVIIPDGTVLQPLGSGLASDTFWTLSSAAFTGGAVDQPGAIVVDLPDTGGVALFNPGGARVDGVAFSSGAVAALEGSPAVPQSASLDFLAPSNGRNLISQDTNNNLNDFKLLERTPDDFN